MWKRFQTHLHRWAIPNPTSIIIAGQAIFYLLSLIGNDQVGGFDLTRIMLLPGEILKGEVWRLFTFIFYPPAREPIFIIFTWLLMYRYGTALEASWGTYRLNLFLWIAILAMIVSHFVVWAFAGDDAIVAAQIFVVSLTGGSININTFIYGTLFLAFARLFPDFVINLMFILPIRIKWLSLIAWLGYGYVFLRGDATVKFVIFASLLNYFLFLGRDHVREFRQGRRRKVFQTAVEKSSRPVHTCLVCGVNSEAAPKTSFRYCSKCEGQCCYCPEHIQNHEHVTSTDAKQET